MSDTIEFFYNRYRMESEKSHERKDAKIKKLETALQYCKLHMIEAHWPKNHPMMSAVRKALSVEHRHCFTWNGDWWAGCACGEYPTAEQIAELESKCECPALSTPRVEAKS